MKKSRNAPRRCKTPDCKRNGKHTQTRHESGLCEQCRGKKPPASKRYETAQAKVTRETAVVKQSPGQTDNDDGTQAST